mmetsp:Transcript_33153/g.38081  ORF Transcript_33153/g.38081 Transcript_33153/m.38081 type:complete len:142 (-) Transcript_33153:35-460(-)
MQTGVESTMRMHEEIKEVPLLEPDADQPMPDDNDDLDSFPELFDIDDADAHKEDSERFIEPSHHEEITDGKDIDLVKDDKIEETIEQTVGELADGLIELTRSLHSVTDRINTRYGIYQQNTSDSISAKITHDDLKNIMNNQ